MTTPLWVPTLLTGVGILIAILGVIAFVIWFLILCIIIAILQVLFKLHLYFKTFYQKIGLIKW